MDRPIRDGEMHEERHTGFNSGHVTVEGANVTNLTIDNNGIVYLGSLQIGVFNYDVDTRAGPTTPITTPRTMKVERYAAMGSRDRRAST